MILRSLLFVPGNSEQLIKKAATTQADALILDLEDSVVNSAKQEARDVSCKMIKSGILAKHHVFVRMNDLESGHLEADFSQLCLEGVTGYVIPKSYTSRDIVSYDNLLTKFETKSKFPRNHFKLIPLIETASAVLHAEDICRASERIIAIAFGSEDFCADLQGIHDEQHNSLLQPRAMIALAARAAGVIPIDTLHVRVHDLKDLEYNLKLARNLGFEGSLLLHPKEIELAHEYFTPSEKEVAQAKKIIELSKQAEEKKISIAVIDGTFIGPPMLRQAKQILIRHEVICRWEESR
jgi:citrate lyase subunit beta/citryl-CoA lyase